MEPLHAYLGHARDCVALKRVRQLRNRAGERSVAYELPHRYFKYNVKDGERHCAAKVFLL
ncbi:hypothetical protein HMPREF0541_01404 [Lacticaseibacillus rhamnosus ATCC 21052]|nr:hypothetical protein HMPREF0541_01404 [Lacticaseibacillus rhamnosus ATCC 21052]